jgi:hypothetical protein
MLPERTQVFIAGGGPFGLTLAIELGRRGIPTVLVEQNPGTTRNAAANATQARTMEHFRRLGFADEVRALGLPPDFPTDIAYFTRFARHELARFTQYYGAHGRAEFNIPGITFGGRYDGSPAIAPDGTSPPPDTPNAYVPSACPGGRPPHLWLGDGRSLYDLFGFEWTLLCFAGTGIAARRNLKVLELENEEARDLYGADLVLIRPDQIVGWRGNDDREAASVLARLTGHG